MPVFSAVHAPDLSQLFLPVAANYTLNIAFRGAGRADRTLQSYLTNYIRATDRALQSYNFGRAKLIEFVASTNGILVYLEALSEFEIAITYARRALRFFEKLRSHPNGPDIERVVARVMASYERRATPVRDAVEHLDERITRGEIAEGQPTALSVSPDGERLEVADVAISFNDLALLLGKLHEVSLQLADPKTAFP
jgi:hypothetical protein